MDLNAEQRDAASHTDGPLQVVAGPGSGKTRVIVEKAARLVAGGIPQESILCMTFTEKAAGEMRRRLRARGIPNAWVGTMHSLCLEILKENSLSTGITADTVIFGELPRLAWCIRNIDKMGIDRDKVNLDRGLRKTCGRMLDAVRLAKRELITPGCMESYVALRSRADPDDEGRLAGLGELVKLYRAYDSYKEEKDLIDYEDMVAAAVEHLQRDGRMSERYGKKYGHVLVDEFQDNNYAQFLLAKMLSGHGNITVVGDRDQSIMGFQGAFDGIFEEFGGTYPDSRSVVLGRNYRCSGSISGLSSRILGGAGGTTEPMRVERGKGRPVVVAAASDEGAEREFVAETVSGMAAKRGRVAVLCRTNRSCQEFAEALEARGIRTVLMGTGSLMRNAAVAEVMALLRTADSPETSGAEISRILMARGIREYNIRDINAKARRRSGAEETPDDGVFHTLAGYSGSDQDAKIREIARRLREMVEYARSADLLDLLHRIMTEYSDAYKKYANADGRDAAKNLALLNRTYEIAEDYKRHYRDGSLSDFIDYWDIVGETDSVDLEADDTAPDDAVSVMTIHKSKGKEFDAVFVTGLYDDNMPGDLRSEEEFAIPAELLRGSGRTRDPEEAHIREQRNLLYVAMTRARDELYLTYPRRAKTSTREREPSRFLVEAEYDSDPCVRLVEYSASARAAPPRDDPDAEKSRIQEEACRAVRESRPEAAIRCVVEMARILHAQKGGRGFDPRTIGVESGRMEELPGTNASLVDKDTLTLSATDIEAYRRCPLQFKYRKILRVPEKPAIHLRKGSVIHSALERMAKERMAGREPDPGEAARLAGEKLDSYSGAYGDREYLKARSSLREIIDYYAEWERGSPNEVVGAEVKFEIDIGGIAYKGKMDRVERRPDGRYEIVDFKTGSGIITRKDLKVNPQANIYAEAARQMYGSLPSRVSLVYLAKRKLRGYDVSKGSLEAGLDVVKECAGAILDEKFDAAPSYDCNFCSYRRICPDSAAG